MLLQFSAGGDGVVCLGEGWAEPEAGFVFALGTRSELALPWPAAWPDGRDWCLELHVSAVLHPPVLTAQRMLVRANGRLLGTATVAERMRFGFIVPATLGGETLRVTIEHPDAARPADLRGGGDRRALSIALREVRLVPLPRDDAARDSRQSARFEIAAHAAGVAPLLAEVVQRLGFPIMDLLGGFESLLDNREFGLFQRKCGYEPLGLLRFAAAPFDSMVHGLHCDFAGLGDPDRLVPQLTDTGEWTVFEDRYKLRYPTGVFEHQAGRDEIVQRETRKLAFLKRKYLEDLDEGHKFFVVRRHRPVPLEDVLPVYAALNRRRANRLLYVEPATPACPSGTVEEVLPGLFHGYIDPPQTADRPVVVSVRGWLEVCAAAWTLAHGANGPAGPVAPPPPAAPAILPPCPDGSTLLLDFGGTGNASRYLGPGWSPPGPGSTFCIGQQSALHLPAVAGDAPGGGWYLELLVSPFVQPEKLPVQRLLVRVNGIAVGAAGLTARGWLGFAVPGWIGGAGLRVTLEHPDAARPADVTGSRDARALALAVHALRLSAMPPDRGTPGRPRVAHVRFAARDPALAVAELRRRFGVTVPDLLGGFESLGDNCEFGLVQRRFGYEPLGLLRFSSTVLEHLTHGLRAGFEGLGDPAALVLQIEGKERAWMVSERRYRLRYHTFLRESQIDGDGIIRREVKKLAFLRRKLLEDLSEGEKFFVLRRDVPLTVEDVLPVHAALLQRGPNRLLYVVPPPEPGLAGTVEELLPGLYRGFIERREPKVNLQAIAFVDWLEICTAAWQLRNAGLDGRALQTG